MSTPAPFSRLQLAAALLEYDNDPDDPDAPYRSAKDSAIFAHLRKNPAARPDGPSRRSDYLGVSIPSEMGSLGGRESVLDTRKSRASRISSLRNPFGPDNASDFGEAEEGEEAEGLEVDLASWGLDAFIPKEKSKSAKAKGKQAVSTLESPRSRLPSTNHDSSIAAARRALVTSTSVSLNNYIGDFEQGAPEHVDRRRSFGSPLELAGMEPSILPRRRAASQGSMMTLSNPVMVPFPTARTPSPGPEDAFAEPKLKAHNRINSMASMNSRLILNEGGEELASRQRNVSNDTMAISNPLEDNPFTIQNPSHTSRFDPKSTARPRSQSNASIGSRMMLENDNASVLTGDPYMRDRRYSTLELLRPKVLVMPSPLQSPPSQGLVGVPDHKVRDGFELSADGPPLPLGARSSRRLSSTLSTFEKGGDIPVASNSFIPNPLMDLSLSQKTFRNTLAAGGQSGGSTLPRATEDGEQVELDPHEKVEQPEISSPPEEHSKASRPAGKLYGKSLIDDLENRKARMRSKQRVFTGDQRPSMMARDQQRASTLIDPASLQVKPSTQRLSSYGPQNTQQGLARQSSLTMKPLLNFDDEGNKPLQPSPAANRVPAARSVFGVDTLWEREMAKLKEIQAMEEKENEERKRKEEEEELKRQKKKDKRNKKNKKPVPSEPEAPEGTIEPHVPAEPPMLPVIQRAPRRGPPKPSDSDESSESSDDNTPLPAAEKAPSWHVGSSDEDDARPRRTTGTGPRYPKRIKKASVPPPAADDSEEDLPLVATLHKAQVRAATSGQNHPVGSDDEDQPLSHLLRRSYSNSIQIKPNPILPNRSRESDEDDDQPLGLRASRITSNIPSAGDEDDVPLAFHPEQQRRTQYQMMAQQQQQQQMMLHAQMQSNMLMNASLMGSSFYPPPVMNSLAMMQMQVPVPIPSPPPIQDEAKFGLVDRWRRDVVIEGDNE